MAEEEEDSSSPVSSHSLKNKLRSTLCFSCCFPHSHRVRPRLVRSSSLHEKPRAAATGLFAELPHIKEKCSNFISRIGRHRRRHSADFHYDPLSYALNFENDAAADDDRSFDDLKSFSARLPQSPPSDAPPAAVEISAVI